MDEPISDETLSDILGLASITVSPASICLWTQEQKDLALNWASASHLSASDNEDVVVPERPGFLAGLDTPFSWPL